MGECQFVFEPFRLDPVSQQFWQGETLVALRPKLFAVLCHLLENAGRLVARDELRAAVWPRTVISESVLRGTIRDLRDVLGDDAGAARFIETVPHRGYRFIARVTTTPVAPAVRADRERPAPDATRPADALLVGRSAELAQLQQWLERAMHGTRQVVFVTGEPGIGKTTLTDAFLATTADMLDVAAARGQCVEHYGSGEAYLPVLEALGQLCRRSDGERTIALLDRHAPTWLAQMPGLLDDAELEAIQRKVQGATRERMLRELAEALESLTADTTVVLALEDLHWSDYSTLDLISVLAQRRTPARLLVLGTYRPADVIVSGHPLRSMMQELRVHQQCEELPLRLLTDVDAYLAARFRHQALPRDLGPAIQRSTEGNPLFVISVVDYWLSQHVLVESGGRWQLAARLEDAAAAVPESLRDMIEMQLARLPSEERRLIEAASVGGAEFSTAMIAAALEEPGERVEDLCEGLAKRAQFLSAKAPERLPDGSVSGRYGFRHALYQQVLYERVAAARRARLHRRIGEWQERAYGSRGADIAAELAMHFERGHDAERALRHLSQAGELALRRSAHPEAISLLTRGLNLLHAMPDTPQRAGHELALQATLGTALTVTKGYAAPEVEQAHRRAFELCQHMGEAPQLFPVLAGLWGFRFLRAELAAAGELATQLSRLARSADAPALLVWAHTLQGLTLSTLGEPRPALEHLEKAMALYDPQVHGPDRTQVGAQDPKVTCLAFAAWTLWRLGYPDQARTRIDDALGLATELSHPFSLAFALDFAAAGVGMFLRDAASVQAHAETLMRLSHEQGFPYWSGWGAVRQGWVLTQQDQIEAGIARMHDGIDTIANTGAALSRSYVLAQLAEAHCAMGHSSDGRALLAQALALVEQTGERWYEAELHRLDGELLLRAQRQPRPAARRARASRRRVSDDGAGGDARRAAAARFRTALEIAERQQAKSFALRAAMSLGRLLQQEGERQPARELLGGVYAWFSEGFDSADLEDARRLLDELA